MTRPVFPGERKDENLDVREGLGVLHEDLSHYLFCSYLKTKAPKEPRSYLNISYNKVWLNLSHQVSSISVHVGHLSPSFNF